MILNDKLFELEKLKKQKALVKLERSELYGCVFIVHSGCNQSHKLDSQYFSFSHAPSLPLDGCTASECTCEYRGVIDKRIENRRVADDGSFSTKDNKRKPNRREVDK